MHYWIEGEENLTVKDIISKYDGDLGRDGDEIVPRIHLGEKFPKVAKDLEAVGYRYSRDRRRFVPLEKEENKN